MTLEEAKEQLQYFIDVRLDNFELKEAMRIILQELKKHEI